MIQHPYASDPVKALSDVTPDKTCPSSNQDTLFMKLILQGIHSRLYHEMALGLEAGKKAIDENHENDDDDRYRFSEFPWLDQYLFSIDCLIGMFRWFDEPNNNHQQDNDDKVDSRN